MATSKAVTVIHDDITLTAAAGDTTSSGHDLQDSHASHVNIELTNGGTGPTIPAQVQVQVSDDDSNWFPFGGPFKGNTDNNGVEAWGGVELPPGTQYVRFVSGTNTGQDVTLRASVGEVTSVT